MKKVLKLSVIAILIIGFTPIKAASVYYPQKTYGCNPGYVARGGLCVPVS